MFTSLITTVVQTLLSKLEANAANLLHPNTLSILSIAVKLLSWFPHPDLKEAVAVQLEAAIKATEGHPQQHELLELGVQFLAVHASGDIQAIAKDVEALEQPAPMPVWPAQEQTAGELWSRPGKQGMFSVASEQAPEAQAAANADGGGALPVEDVAQDGPINEQDGTHADAAHDE